MESLQSPKEESPDPAVKARFMEVLDAYRAGMGNVAEMPKPKVSVLQRPAWLAAMAAGLLILGVFAGRYGAQPKQESPEVAQLKGQVESLRHTASRSRSRTSRCGRRSSTP
jgi:hypothetical protein